VTAKWRTGTRHSFRASSRRRAGYSRSAGSSAKLAKRYSLEQLLERQPKTLSKHPDYPELLGYLQHDAALQRVRMIRRCYTLLHHARIAEGNLPHLMRTYRLPRHPFFALFLKMKREYLHEREQARQARFQYIVGEMRLLPAPVVEFTRYLGFLENSYNAAGAHPLWQEHLFPRSKRQVHEYRRLSPPDWLDVFRAHLGRLEQRYRACSAGTTELLLATFVLQCLPSGYPPSRPSAELVKRRYRHLSLQHHPDQGGDARMFVELKRARDHLLQQS